MTINPSSQEKVLIIGCGDIGQRLARQLDGAAYTTVGLRRSALADLPYLRYQQADATDATQLALLLNENFNVIVITMTPSERSDAGYQSAYVSSCRALLEGLRGKPVPRLILFASSTAVYAQHDGRWVDESSPTQPESFSGKRLLEAEQLLAHSGYPHCIVRFSGIYGPGRHRLIEQVKQRRASASPHFTNRIHADDCAGVLVHLITLSKQQILESVYLATDSSPTPMVEVVSWIAQQLGIEEFIAADTLNERGNKQISNKRLVDSGYQLQYPNFQAGYSELLHE
jgi:nucleoside-diphosphate-sugar epimerase